MPCRVALYAVAIALHAMTGGIVCHVVWHTMPEPVGCDGMAVMSCGAGVASVSRRVAVRHVTIRPAGCGVRVAGMRRRCP